MHSAPETANLCSLVAEVTEQTLQVCIMPHCVLLSHGLAMLVRNVCAMLLWCCKGTLPRALNNNNNNNYAFHLTMS